MTAFDDETDEAAMAEAEAALKALAAEYPAYAVADVDQMDASMKALRAVEGADAALVAAVYATAHNIKGQGSAFGYDLMTEFGEALCALTRDRTALESAPLAAATALIAACRTVLTERLTGDGGVFGAQLRANLGLSLKAA